MILRVIVEGRQLSDPTAGCTLALNARLAELTRKRFIPSRGNNSHGTSYPVAHGGS
jgi:hypothetical protein